MQRYRYLLSIVYFLGLLFAGCLPKTTPQETIIAPKVTEASSEGSTALPTPTPPNEAEQAKASLPAAPTQTSCHTRASTAPPTSPPSSLKVKGIERSFITHIPETYTPDKAHALVFAFHGRTSPNYEVQQYFDLESAMPSALIVYPSALRQGSGFSWANQGDDPSALRDYALFDELLELMKAAYCVDEQKVFVVGHSLGAYFANDLACARATKIRAVASLAGGLQQASCPESISAMLLHHPEDRLVPLKEGLNARSIFTFINQSQEARAVSNPLLQSFGCQRYDASKHLVLWCQHPFATSYNGSYYPHNWPAKTAEAINIFFNALP